MHLHMQANTFLDDDDDYPPSSSSKSSESEDENDQDWNDWVEDSQPCLSLFEEKSFPSADEAVAYDSKTHGFDLTKISSSLSLDIHKRIRLVNYIRKTKLASKDLQNLRGDEEFFASEEYLIPAVENDPLLQMGSDDWSDDDQDQQGSSSDPEKVLQALRKQITDVTRQLKEYREFVSQRLVSSLDSGSSSTTQKHARDDDSHYFTSYGEHDIHAVMIQDKVRTSTYASFILRNPTLFQDAVVLDVGCGTGILSLFAAKGGAKRVFAVDASDIAEKAEKIVKANGLDHIITVIRGKVEDITLPDGITHVDVIISEWMGYALLYESMLDSVLHARDRFLKPDSGVMAPSQCKMMLALCDASEIRKDRVEFWNDVYGFDLSVMSEEHYGEAIVDIIGPNALLSEPFAVKDIPISSVKAQQLNFTSQFTLVSTASRRTKLTGFVLYFDTFFTLSGNPVPEGTEAKVVGSDDMQLAEIWAVGGRAALQRRRSRSRSVSMGKIKSALHDKSHDGEEKEDIPSSPEIPLVEPPKEEDVAASFSTGPRSMATHWKQTIFLLKEPIHIVEGNVVYGKFFCKKSDDNSRELDVEVHFSVKETVDSPSTSDTVVQMYKVR